MGKIAGFAAFRPVLALILAGIAGVAAAAEGAAPLPRDFVHVSDAVPDAILEIRYFSTYNFVGDRIFSYRAPVAILTRPAARALKRASDAARARGYVIKVFDAYRPQSAVDHFIHWGMSAEDQRMKRFFYPGVDKSVLFKRGYIAMRSGHSRGSTVDLTLVGMESGREIDMGSPFDFFGEISRHGTPLATPAQAANREILKSVMTAAGFRPYSEEWWHYTLADEPYPDTYFDFPVDW